MDGAGMRWIKQCAQSILDLRGTRMNKDWDDYQCFYRKRQDFQLYGSDSNPPPIVENNISGRAA